MCAVLHMYSMQRTELRLLTAADTLVSTSLLHTALWHSTTSVALFCCYAISVFCVRLTTFRHFNLCKKCFVLLSSTQAILVCYRSFVISLSLISLHQFGFLMRVTTPTTSQTLSPYMLYADDHNLTLRDHLLSLDFLGCNSGRTVRQRSQYLCVLAWTQCLLIHQHLHHYSFQ